MEDLSHWEAATDFSASEAAALIAGIDPHDPSASHHKVVPILSRISASYEAARRRVAGIPMNNEQFSMWRGTEPDALASVRVECYPLNRKDPWPGNPERSWDLPKQFRGEYGDLQQQRFSRAELQRWSSKIGLTPRYQFQRQQTPDKDQKGKAGTPLVAALASVVAEGSFMSVDTKEQRQDYRLAYCENAGLNMPNSYLGRLPNGVGKAAKQLGIERQSLAIDLKAALERRESKKREGVRVHRS